MPPRSWTSSERFELFVQLDEYLLDGASGHSTKVIMTSVECEISRAFRDNAFPKSESLPRSKSDHAYLIVTCTLNDLPPAKSRTNTAVPRLTLKPVTTFKTMR